MLWAFISSPQPKATFQALQNSGCSHMLLCFGCNIYELNLWILVVNSGTCQLPILNSHPEWWLVHWHPKLLPG